MEYQSALAQRTYDVCKKLGILDSGLVDIIQEMETSFVKKIEEIRGGKLLGREYVPKLLR
jgi:hypothetical protein